MLGHVRFPKDMFSQRHKSPFWGSISCVVFGAWEAREHHKSVGMIAMTQTNKLIPQCSFFPLNNVTWQHKVLHTQKKQQIHARLIWKDLFNKIPLQKKNLPSFLNIHLLTRCQWPFCKVLRATIHLSVYLESRQQKVSAVWKPSL